MDNFKFPFAFASKRKKLDALDGLPQFSWHETASQEVIGQGSFGAVFITRYQTTAKPAETVVVKKLLHTASNFTETFIKEAKISQTIIPRFFLKQNVASCYVHDFRYPRFF